ncbi:MAG TPA: peptidase M23, partial [Psychromonas hadalis]|nr:peptidase M23 [Psychromonas hadalis]
MFSKPNSNSFFKKIVTSINNLPRKHFFALIILFVCVLILSFIPANTDTANQINRKIIPSTSNSQGLPSAEPLEKQEEHPKKLPDRVVSITVKSGDTLSRIFQDEGLPTSLLQELLVVDSDHLRLDNLRIGQVLELVIGKNHKLKSLSVIISHSETLHFILKDDEYIANMETKETLWQTELFHGKVTGSFTESAEKAGLSIRQTYQVIGALSE